MLNQAGMPRHSLSTVGHSDAATWPIGGFPVDHKALATPILERPVFERLLFSQCWEDPCIDAESLCLKPGKTALVVTSGGSTALSLALLGPDRILRVDHIQVETMELGTFLAKMPGCTSGLRFGSALLAARAFPRLGHGLYEHVGCALLVTDPVPDHCTLEAGIRGSY